MEYELLLLNLSRCANLQAQYFRECIGQHMIASYLAQHDFRAKVFSGDILLAEALIGREVEKHGVRCVGFYVAADTVVMIGNLIRHLKATTGLTIFVGGPQAAALGEAFLRETGCDFIVVGEGEIPVLKLMAYLEDHVGQLEQLESVRYLDAGGVYHAAPLAGLVEDLDMLPYPRREDSLHKGFRMGNAMGLLTGRGCPFHCAFCYEGASSKVVRYRSIENVMGEIDDVLSYNKSLAYVNVFDDTFTLKPERVHEFCRGMEQRGLRWTCEGHVSCILNHPEMLERMIDSGLVAMQIGIESGSRRVLEAYEKHTTPEMTEEVVRLCYDMGLATLEGNYIIGGAFESNATLSESLEHAKRLIEAGRGMMEIQTVFFAPYYDTPITKCPERYGMRLLADRIDHAIVTMREPVVETNELSAEEIAAWKKRFETELAQKYREQAACCKKSDVVRGRLSDGPMEMRGYRWRKAWDEIPHFADFLRHLTKTEQEYASGKYPVRVGMAQFSGERISVDGIMLTEPDVAAWYLADGRHTAGQIAEILEVSTERISKIYTELNERCLVYFALY